MTLRNIGNHVQDAITRKNETHSNEAIWTLTDIMVSIYTGHPDKQDRSNVILPRHFK
jgi:hypothetical protein